MNASSSFTDRDYRAFLLPKHVRIYSSKNNCVNEKNMNKGRLCTRRICRSPISNVFLNSIYDLALHSSVELDVTERVSKEMKQSSYQIENAYNEFKRLDT
jgi:hypothetical protein